MSKMSDLVTQIQDLTINGYEPEVIALMCEVPIGWVYEALAMNEDEVLQEYNTSELALDN